MKIGYFAVFGLLGYGVYKWGSRMAAAANALTYEPRGVKLGKQRRIIAKIAIVNAAPVPLFFDEVQLNAFWNTSDLGAVHLTERVIVPANGEVVKEFPFQVQAVGLVSAIIAAIKDGKLGKVSLKGYVKAGPIRIPVEITQELSK